MILIVQIILGILGLSLTYSLFSLGLKILRTGEHQTTLYTGFQNKRDIHLKDEPARWYGVAQIAIALLILASVLSVILWGEDALFTFWLLCLPAIFAVIR